MVKIKERYIAKEKIKQNPKTTAIKKQQLQNTQPRKKQIELRMHLSFIFLCLKTPFSVCLALRLEMNIKRVHQPGQRLTLRSEPSLQTSETHLLPGPVLFRLRASSRAVWRPSERKRFLCCVCVF